MEYVTEEQQVEQLKKWWKEYGLSIIAGVVIAILLVVGWRYYKGYETKKAQSASLIYTTMMDSVMSNQTNSAVDAAHAVIKKFPSTPYADFASLWLAKNAVDNKQYAQALTQLNWVLDHTSTNAIKQVARLRLASVYIQEKKPQAALKTLNVVNEKSYAGLVDELKGDAYLQMNNVAMARKSYQSAIAKLPGANVSRPILEMKLADLPVAK